MTMGPRSEILGVVLAGGRSSRYGSDKAFADLGGVSLVRRASRTLGAVAARIVVVANDLARHATEGLAVRPDLVPGIGPLGGLHTGLAWAAEEGLLGAIVLATDMPFVPASLLGEVIGRLGPGVAAVPASSGPRGFEPLCAAYDVGCLPAVQAAVDRNDRAVVSFFGDVQVHVVDLEDISAHGDPDTMFFNVNRPEDHLRADMLLEELRAAEAGPNQESRTEEE